MFGTSFLPTPAHFEAFKKFLSLQYMGKSPEIINQHLDMMELARHEMKMDGFTPADEEIWTRNAMGFPGYGKLYGSAKEMLNAIETWMDSIES